MLYIVGMGKGKSEKKAKAGKVKAKFPKKKCCEKRTRCSRCPLRMLKEGTMPEGWTVRHRRLVKTDKVTHLACHSTKKKLKKSGSKKVDVKGKKSKKGKKAA